MQVQVTLSFELDANNNELLEKLALIANALTPTVYTEEKTAPVEVKEKRTRSAKAEPTPVTQAEIKAENAVTHANMTAVKDAEPANEGKAWTFDEVRPIAVKISKDGKREEVKALIKKHGAEELAGLDPKRYAAFMVELEQLKTDEDI